MDSQVIDILKTVIQQHGEGVLTDVRCCRALLQDLCRGAYVREVRLLLLALQEGVATELRNPPAGLPATLLGSRLVERLVTEHFLDRTAAEWAVLAWAIALGVSLPTVEKVPILPSSQPMGPGFTTDIPTNLGIELLNVSAGAFFFGEKIERKHLPDFAIMKYPVTVGQYRLFCNATERAMPSAPTWGWQENHPMVNVTWHDATAFAAWTGLVLPTEEEWEKAARGKDGCEYPWGNGWEPSKCCNSVVKSASTCAVGSYPAGASPYGMQDMAGNVWEWCDGWYDSRKSTRVLRGGSWCSNLAVYLRATYRINGNPSHRDYDYGFRCVRRSPGS